MKKTLQCLGAASAGMILSWSLLPSGGSPEHSPPAAPGAVTRELPATKAAPTESPAEILTAADANASPDAVWAAIERTLSIPDSLLPDAPQLILKLSDDHARRWLTRGLYTRWAELNDHAAHAALVSAAGLPPPMDYTAREAVLLAMARRDPAGTLAMTKEMVPGNSRGMGPNCPVLAEWARTDPRSALAHVLEAQGRAGDGAFDDQPLSKALRQQTYTVLAVWMERDPAEFATWFRTLPDGMERRFIARRISLAGERFAPEMTAALAMELPGSGIGRRGGYYPVAHALTSVDKALTTLPADQWTWETGLVFADMDGGGMRAAVPPEDINTAAAALLERLPEGLAADGVRCGAAIRSGFWPAAAEAAARFPESSERAAVWRQIIAGWSAADRPSAEAWLAEQPEGFSRAHALTFLAAPQE